MNWLAVIVAGVADWLLGALWYSALFGKIWAAGLEQQGVKLQKPSQPQLMTKLAGNFVANLLTATVIGHLVLATAVASLLGAVHLGAALGLGVAGMALAVAYTWESKPVKVWAIDAAYHLLGCIACAVILACWR
jgi:hypothetical protein